MSRTAADLIIGRGVAHAYTARAAWIDLAATARHLTRMPLTRAEMRHYAAIARRAAVADRDDPLPPKIVPCGVCGGIRICLAMHS